MAKVTEVVLELKEGLPNYSGRTATVKVVADEEESLDVSACLIQLRQEIRNGWKLGTDALPVQGAATAQTVAAPAAEKPAEEPKAKTKKAKEEAPKPAEKPADKPAEPAKMPDAAPKSSLSSFLDED